MDCPADDRGLQGHKANRIHNLGFLTFSLLVAASSTNGRWGKAMTYLETQLVDRCNRLTAMIFLQELRAQVLARQVREANAVIEETTRQFQDLTQELLGAVSVYDGFGERIA